VYGTINTTQLYGGVRSVPTSFVIDREGKVVSRYVGLAPKSNYVRDIDKILSDNYDNTESVDAPDFKLPLVEVN
jgi:peroxiredoxin